MEKIQLNREFARRHLGVALLMLGLCAWFGYDGFVRYPQLSAHDLYVRIETSEPRAGADLEAFKRQKIQTQYGFTLLTFLAGLVIGLGVWRHGRQTLAWDETSMQGSLTRNRPLPFSEIARVDTRRWDSKGILVVFAQDGRRVTLDAWHHTGVRAVAEIILRQNAAHTDAEDRRA